MKILIITDQFPKLSETFIINHISALLESGYNIKIIARNTRQDIKIHPKVKQLNLIEKTIYFDLPQNYLIRLIFALKILLKAQDYRSLFESVNIRKYGLGVLTLQSLFRWRHLPADSFDLIHCHYGNIAWNCLALKNKYNASFIVSFHGTEFIKFSKLSHFLFRKLFQNSDGIIANSEYSKKLIEKHGCPPNKIVKIPAISYNNGSFLRRKKLNFKNPKIISVARLNEAKGIQYAIFALKQLVRKGYHFNYKIIGDGPYRETLKSLVYNLHLNNYVEFTGWLDQEELFKFYKDSDILILPSIKGRDGCIETQGVVIQEAQRCRVLVIASNIGGIPEGLNYGKAGILFESGNVNDLVDKMRYVFNNPKEAIKIAKAGNEYFRRKYSKEKIMKNLLSFYEEISKSNI